MSLSIDVEALLDGLQGFRAARIPVLEPHQAAGELVEEDAEFLDGPQGGRNGRLEGRQVLQHGLEAGEQGQEGFLAGIAQIDGLLDEGGDLAGVLEDLPRLGELFVLSGLEAGRFDLADLEGEEIEPLGAVPAPGLEVLLLAQDGPQLPGRQGDLAP